MNRQQNKTKNKQEINNNNQKFKLKINNRRLMLSRSIDHHKFKRIKLIRKIKKRKMMEMIRKKRCLNSQERLQKRKHQKLHPRNRPKQLLRSQQAKLIIMKEKLKRLIRLNHKVKPNLLLTNGLSRKALPAYHLTNRKRILFRLIHLHKWRIQTQLKLKSRTKMNKSLKLKPLLQGQLKF